MDKENLKCAGTVVQGRVTVDAVHPRLLDKSKHIQSSRSKETRGEALPAYCPECNVNLGCTVMALRNHFESFPHESQPCVYCAGPVYKYICTSDKHFHECIANVMQGRETGHTLSSSKDEGSDTLSLSKDEGSDTLSLSKDEGSDTGEMQSVSSTQDIESLLFVNDTHTEHS